MSGAAAALRTTASLTPQEVGTILELAAEAAEADGVPPLGEHVLLHVRHGGAGRHVLASDRAGRLTGYAHLDLSDPADGPAIELAVSPTARNMGVGTALLDAALALCPPPPHPVRLWSHGEHAAAGALAHARGFTQERHLWQLRRSLHAALPALELPPDVALRQFDPAHDQDAVLAVNAAAFTELPDQGGWTREDLRRRMAEPWFDPAGFLLAVEEDGTGGERLLGFHWTKVHAAHGPGPADRLPPDPLGEVYVLGVHPGARGRGLGRALTLAGLHHLRSLGLPGALLYVDGTNAPAIALYTSLGFGVWDSDTLFRR